MVVIGTEKIGQPSVAAIHTEKRINCLLPWMGTGKKKKCVLKGATCFRYIRRSKELSVKRLDKWEV